MVLSTPNRKSGLPTPGSSRKSKLQTPQSISRSSRLTKHTLSSTSKVTRNHDNDILRSNSSSHLGGNTPNPTLETAKQPLVESTTCSVSGKKSDHDKVRSDAMKMLQMADRVSKCEYLGVSSPIRSTSSKNSTLEAAKRSLDESTAFLPEKKKSTSPQRTRRQSSGASSRRFSSGSVLGSSASANPSLGEEAVRVGVRIRPLLDNDEEHRSFVLGPTENTIVRSVGGGDNNAYQFNHVYGETSSTQQLYDDMVSDIVESVGCQGRNGTVFTYGQTSTGKTYTMHGILMAAGRDLFEMIQDEDDMDSATTSLTSLRISCMELYNEELRDLLCTSSVGLSIQEDQRGNVKVPNLSERMCSSIDELMEVIQLAEENRTVGSTAMNERSSRSHTIFRMTLVKKVATKIGGSLGAMDICEEEEDKENDTTRSSSQRGTQKVVTTVSTLNLVDLAGSESVRVTGAKGERQKEGGKINQSLLTLSRVLSKLGKKDRGHINYRDSKLTRILKPSLSGNARMGCICCISPAVQYSEESKSTLDFASRTMLVTTNAKSNQTVEYDDALVEEFEREIERAREETAKAEENRRKMEQALQEAQDQIVCLRASAELEKSKIAGLEKKNSEHMAQMEELKSGHENSTQELLKEINELKSRNQALEAKVAESEAENIQLKEKQESDRNHYDNELRVMEVQQTTLANEHEIRVQNLNTEAREYKRKYEEIEVMYDELQIETERIRDELETEVRQTLIQKCDSNEEFQGRATELEHKNSVLAEQLDVVKQDNKASQEEIASLKFELDVLKEEKLQTEWKLAREKQKSQKRKDEAKERRKKFRDSLQGFQETLKDDLVQMSYEK